MSQNTSHAVMTQRAEPSDSLDFFPTPPWATRALVEILRAEDPSLEHRSCWEPAAGAGDMVRPLKETFRDVYATDVHQWGGADVVDDFLLPGWAEMPDWIITNPPFLLAERFIETSLRRAKRGVAMLVRTSFLESVGRYQRLFNVTPPHVVAQFVERVPMFKGRLDPTGSTATAYCWLIWWIGATRGAPRFRWIAPCRKRLERAGDYDGGAA